MRVGPQARDCFCLCQARNAMHCKYQADQALIQGQRIMMEGTMGKKAMQRGETGMGEGAHKYARAHGVT